MMATVVADELLTVEEYLRHPSYGRGMELVRGRIVPVSPTSFLHGRVCTKTARILGNFVEEHDLGHVVTGDTGIVTQREPDTVRGADIAFFTYARVPRDAVPPEGFAETRPDLVVEVRSPSDRPGEIFAKVLDYQTAGVPYVVYLDPRHQTLTLFLLDNTVTSFRADEDFAVPDILPGFSARVGHFFE